MDNPEEAHESVGPPCTGAQAELERLRHSPVGVHAEATWFDPPLRLADGPSFAAQYDSIFVAEIYDFVHEGPSPTIVDCGANIGLGIVWWRARWPAARIIGFEPDPNVFEILRWNTRHHEGVELRQLAVTATGGALAFRSDGTDGGRVDRRRKSSSGVPLITVDSTTLSAVLLPLGAVALLKLDIEGSETEVLTEAEGELGAVERLFVEYHSFVGEPQSLPDLLGILRRGGFRYYLETPVRSFRPFRGVNVDRGIDMQCDIYAWRE